MGNLLDPTDSQVDYKNQDRRKGPDRRRAVDDGGKFFERMKDWCRGRSANARLPLGVWFFLLFFVYFWNPTLAARIDFINASTHGIGHFILGGILPEDIWAACGWFVQFGVPVIAGILFSRSFDYFGVSLSFAWFGTAMLWNAPYASSVGSDAMPRYALRLGEPVHDWTELMTFINAIEDKDAIAMTLRWGGLLALAFGIYFLCSQLYFMWTLEERRKETERRVKAVGG